MHAHIVRLSLLSTLAACTFGGTVTGKVTDPMTGQPRANLRVVANANPNSPDPTCQMRDGTTGADGTFTISETCSGTSYDLALKDDSLLIPGDTKAAGGGPVGPLTLEAWRAPKDAGVFLLKDDKLSPQRTSANLDSETITGTTETVWYPDAIPGKVPVIEPGLYLVVSGKELVEGLKFQPLLAHPGKLRFPTGEETFVDIENHAFIGTTFTSDTEFQRVTVDIDASKQKEATKADRIVRYYAADALPPGRYVMMREGDKRIYVFDMGTGAPAATAANEPAAAADGAAADAEGAKTE